MSEEANPRTQIFNLCRDKIGRLPLWTVIEPEIVMYCANITDTGKESDKDSVLIALLGIKKLLQSHGLAVEFTEFVDDEIELIQQSKQMSIYTEKNDYIDEATIKRHIHISMTNEGIIGIPGKWTYEQCRRITNGVYHNTGLVKFFISKEQTIKGRIVAEFFSNMQEIPVCAILRPKKQDQQAINVISFFGEHIDTKKFSKLREITASMHVYRFLLDNSAEYVLLSTATLDIGEYEVDGTITTLNDNKTLTESAKMLTKMPYFFCNEARSIITKYRSMTEYADHVNKLQLSKEKLFNYPFTFTTAAGGVETQYVQRHPSWFKWLIWSWLTHKEKGDSSKYPLHLVIVAPPNCLAKGTLVQTDKGLVPIECVGNSVVSIDSTGTRINTPCKTVSQGLSEVYEIITSDGQRVLATAKHLWPALVGGVVREISTEDLYLDDAYMHHHDDSELPTLPTPIHSTRFSRKTFLQPYLLRSVQLTKQVRERKSVLEENRREEDEKVILGRTVPSSNRARTRGKSPSDIGTIETHQHTIADEGRNPQNNSSHTTKQVRERKIDWREESCVFAWQEYRTKEEQRGISGKSEEVQRMDMCDMQNEKRKEKRSGCASQKQKQQRQSEKQSSGALSIVPCKITSIKKLPQQVEVFDLVVPNHHTFLLKDGLITHNSGKTLLANGLHKRTLEHHPVFTGSGSTVKEIVPSFHATPPKAGYFALSHRFAFFDEFFRCLQNVSDDDRRHEALARMNDLLEHQKRTYGSGKGNITVQGTARAMMTNNPPRGVRSVEDLLQTFDQSFLSRSLIYFQDDKDEHFRMVRESSLADCTQYNDRITAEDFVGLLDFLHNFHANYDLSRVHEVYQRSLPLLTSTQLGHYEARHRHHIECLIDGLVKARVLMECGTDFTATEEDYDRLETVWVHVIRSWVRSEQVKSVPLRFRIKYLPDMCQWVYKLIKDNTTDDNPTIGRELLTELALKGLDRSNFYAAFTILRENKLIDDSDGIRLYFRAPEYSAETEQRKVFNIILED